MWRDILVAAAVIVVLPAISTLLTPLYALYREQMGISLVTLTLIYAVYVIGNLGALLVFGGLSDAVGRRPVVLASFAIAALSAVTFMFARHGWELGLARVFSGLGVGIGSGAVAAWLVELMGLQDRSQAAIILTTANFIGLGAGALLAGALADHAPAPLLLPFVVYLAVLAVTTALILRTPETVAPETLRPFALTWPRLGVPADLRASFVAPAISGFGSMALVGFYACLAPGILAQTLGVRSNLAAGAILFELAAVAAATILMTRSVPSARAMWVSLLLIVPAIALVVVAQISASLLVMIAATALCGVAAA
ncbi:MFS transporter, partial [Escherichia coli]|nr:MFS transporter [Escherichia coli]